MTKEEIISYEKMAKLSLPENERETILRTATALSDSFEALASVETDKVLPLVTVLDMKNVLREDKAVKNFTREEITAGAPEQYDGYFQVPKTLE